MWLPQFLTAIETAVVWINSVRKGYSIWRKLFLTLPFCQSNSMFLLSVEYFFIDINYSTFFGCCLQCFFIDKCRLWSWRLLGGLGEGGGGWGGVGQVYHPGSKLGLKRKGKKSYLGRVFSSRGEISWEGGAKIIKKVVNLP